MGIVLKRELDPLFETLALLSVEIPKHGGKRSSGISMASDLEGRCFIRNIFRR